MPPVAWMTPAEIAKRAIGYAEHLQREGPVGGAEDVPGPGPGERLRPIRESSSDGALLRLHVEGES